MFIRNAALAAALLSVTSCAQISTGVATVCADLARMPPFSVGVLDAQDPHSTVGVIWADMKSACVAGAPVVGVSDDWRGMLWGELKVIIPQLLPQLIPLLIGLL